MASKIKQQAFRNGEVHDWYRLIWGYSDHLVGALLDELQIRESDRVLDPFCGSGTTLVECKKLGIDAVGIDANPASCFATAVKTSWGVRSEDLLEGAEEVACLFELLLNDRKALKGDLTYRYITSSGMKDRGWICERPLLKAIALKHAIVSLSVRNTLVRPYLMLALLSEVVWGSSNVKFGPELYCSSPKGDADVLNGYLARVQQMADDLDKTTNVPSSRTRVFRGDSRRLQAARQVRRLGKYSAIICSPPYPTEHDYTRNSRLELAFLEQVKDVHSLREIKKEMLRSHTKGIYVEDIDAAEVARKRNISALARRIQRRAPEDSQGFVRLYPEVVRHYFGGMRRHFRGARTLLRKGAIAAYIVGDQASYHGIHIPTANILGDLAKSEGFKVVDIREWRERRATGRPQKIVENILLLRRL